MDCGPTCLRMVAKHYTKSISLQQLRDRTQIGKEGVNLLGIAEAAETLGFRTQSVKINYASLVNDAVLPAILHWNQNHFVVLYRVKSKSFFRKQEILMIADPAKGLINFTPAEFKQHWISHKEDGEEEGIALLLEPGPAFYKYQDDSVSPSSGPGEVREGAGFNFRNIFSYISPYRNLIFQLLLDLGFPACSSYFSPFLLKA